MKKYIPLVIMGLALVGCRNSDVNVNGTPANDDDGERTEVQETANQADTRSFDGYYTMNFFTLQDGCANITNVELKVSSSKLYPSHINVSDYDFSGITLGDSVEDGDTFGSVEGTMSNGTVSIAFSGDAKQNFGMDGFWSDGNCSGNFIGDYTGGLFGEPTLNPNELEDTADS